jgi:hypothetical protein
VLDDVDVSFAVSAAVLNAAANRGDHRVQPSDARPQRDFPSQRSHDDGL